MAEITNCLDEELEALGAIYCDKDEFVIHDSCQRNGSIINATVSMTIGSSESHTAQGSGHITLTLTMDENYPKELPATMALSSGFLTRTVCEKVKRDLLLYCSSSLLGEPMLMAIRMWLEENWKHYWDRTEETEENLTEESHWCLLHLDHMRAKAKYVKTILKWCKELCLHGRLIFCDKLILILLQGNQNAIKDYINRQRTVSIDIDSKGRSCKERMLSQLTDVQQLQSKMLKFTEFKVEDIAARTDLEKQFSSFGLLSVFNNEIKSLSK